MKRVLSLSFLFMLVFAMPVSASTSNSGSESVESLYEALEADEQAWFVRALDKDRPMMLTIHVDEEGVTLWNAEVHAPDLMRSCLKALKAVEVDVTNDAPWREGAVPQPMQTCR